MKQTKEYLQIAYKAITDKEQRLFEITFEHTTHSYLRACQRGFNNQKIVAALQYGENVYKQGLIYYILGENNIPYSLCKQKEKLKNTVVIVSGNSNQVITCYRSTNPFKNIRIKSEKLCKKYKYVA
jgi:hypothetical protein